MATELSKNNWKRASGKGGGERQRLNFSRLAGAIRSAVRGFPRETRINQQTRQEKRIEIESIT